MKTSWHFSIPASLLQPTVDRLAVETKISTLSQQNTQAILSLFRLFSTYRDLPLGLNPKQRKKLQDNLQRQKRDPNATIRELACLVKTLRYLKERYDKRKAVAEKLRLPLFSTYDSHDISTVALTLLTPIENYISNARDELKYCRFPHQKKHPLNQFKKFIEETEKKLIMHQTAIAKCMMVRLQTADEHQDIYFDDALPESESDRYSRNLEPKDFIKFHAYIEQYADEATRHDLYRLSWIQTHTVSLSSIVRPKKTRRWPTWLFRGNVIRFKAFGDPHHQVFLHLKINRLHNEKHYESIRKLEQVYYHEYERLRLLQKRLYRPFHRSTINRLSKQMEKLRQHQRSAHRKQQIIQQQQLANFIKICRKIHQNPAPHFFEAFKKDLPQNQQDSIDFIKQFISGRLFTKESPTIDEVLQRLSPVIQEPEEYLRYLVIEHLSPHLHSSDQPEFQFFLAYEKQYGEIGQRKKLLMNLERYNDHIAQSYFAKLLTYDSHEITLDGRSYLTDIATQEQMRHSLKNRKALQPLFIQTLHSATPKNYLKMDRLVNTLGDAPVKMLWSKHIEEKQFLYIMAQLFIKRDQEPDKPPNGLMMPMKSATIERIKPFICHLPTDHWTEQQHTLCESIQSQEFKEQYHLQLLKKTLTHPPFAEQGIHRLLDIDFYQYFGFRHLQNLDEIYTNAMTSMLSQTTIDHPKAADLIIQQFTTHQLTAIEFPHLAQMLDQLIEKRLEEKEADSFAASIQADLIEDQFTFALSRLEHLQQSISEPLHQTTFSHLMDTLTQLFIECCRTHRITLLTRLSRLNQSIIDHRLSRNFKQLISQWQSLTVKHETIRMEKPILSHSETAQSVQAELTLLIHGEMAAEQYFERFNQLKILAKRLPSTERYQRIKRLCDSGAHIQSIINELPNAILALASGETTSVHSINPLLLDIIDAHLIQPQEKNRLVQLIHAALLDPDNVTEIPRQEQQRLVALKNCLSSNSREEDRSLFSIPHSQYPFRLTQTTETPLSNTPGEDHANSILHL